VTLNSEQSMNDLLAKQLGQEKSKHKLAGQRAIPDSPGAATSPNNVGGSGSRLVLFEMQDGSDRANLEGVVLGQLAQPKH
jgi:hypothetical protein